MSESILSTIRKFNREDVIKNCGKRIRDLRQDCDYTQVQIASYLNITQKTYSDYENGKIRIPIDSLVLLAVLYDVSLDFISGISKKKEKFPKNICKSL